MVRVREGMLYIDLPGYRTGLFFALGWELAGGRWGSLFLLELGLVGGLEGSCHSRGPTLGAQLWGFCSQGGEGRGRVKVFCHPMIPFPFSYVCVSHLLFLHKKKACVPCFWGAGQDIIRPYFSGFGVDGRAVERLKPNHGLLL